MKLTGICYRGENIAGGRRVQDSEEPNNVDIQCGIYRPEKQGNRVSLC